MDGKTALHFAAENNLLSVCQKIIEVCDEDDPEDDDGNTPYFWAVTNRHWEVCELFSDSALSSASSTAKIFHLLQAGLSKRRKLS